MFGITYKGLVGTHPDGLQYLLRVSCADAQIHEFFLDILACTLFHNPDKNVSSYKYILMCRLHKQKDKRGSHPPESGSLKSESASERAVCDRKSSLD